MIPSVTPASAEPGEGPDFVLETSMGRMYRRHPLTFDSALDADRQPVHISSACAGRTYRCSYCGGLLRVRECADRRNHFVHLCNAGCINPGTVHQHAIQTVAAEGRIDTGGADLIGGLPGGGFIAGPARPEAPWRVATEGASSRMRRADVAFDLAWRVVAVEFICTHALDHAKLLDYRWLAADLAARGKALQLLIVYLWPDRAAFCRWDRATWREYFLSKASRRWVAVPELGPGCP